MGNIFSQARLVIAWLGSEPDVASFISSVRDSSNSDGKVASAASVNAFYSKAKDRMEQRKAFLNHDYWTRAWITQELLLAQQVQLLACDFALEFAELAKRHRYYDGYQGEESDRLQRSNS